MPDLLNGWRPASRPALAERQRLARLADLELAAELGPDADAERVQRARERSCEHTARRLGRSTVVRCGKCGALRLPDVDASGPAAQMPSTPEARGGQRRR